MKILYDLTKLDEVGNRLRYLMAQQIESTLSGLFPKVIALPFGSSVNGYGKIGCDLDLVLRLNEHEQVHLTIYFCKLTKTLNNLSMTVCARISF